MGYALLKGSRISPDEYLAGEQTSDTKYEYIDGEVYAMAGASDRHVKVSGNTYALIRQHLRGSGCSTYIADMKVRIGKDEAFFYPDVMVTCDPVDQLSEQDYAKNSPKLIIEVLSPSTESKDRGSKFMRYRQLASLQEYVLIDPNHYYAEVFRRQNENEWLLSTCQGQAASLTLQSIGLTLSLLDLYEDVRFDVSPAA